MRLARRGGWVPVRRGGNGPPPGARVACAMWMSRHASGRFARARRWPQEGPDADGLARRGERRLAPGRCRVGPVVGASGTRVSWSGLSCHIDAAMVPHRTRHHPALGLKTTVRKTPNLIFVENGKWGGKSRRENEVDITGYRKQNISIGNMPVTIGGTPTHVTI